MTNNQEIDKNFSGRLNILRAGVLGANDGIISIAGVVIGVASATESVWIIFLSGLAAVARERVLLTKNPEIARQSLYAAYIQNGECETSAQLLTNRAFLKNPLKALVEEKYGLEVEEFTNPWHAAISSFIAFAVGAIFPMLTIVFLPASYRIPATVIVVALALLGTGYTSAKLGKAPIKNAVIRNLVIGLLTMTVTYLVGQLFVI